MSLQNGCADALHYWPQYPKDWLGSIRVQLMSLAEEGACLRLMSYQWLQGSLPAEPEAMKALIGKESGGVRVAILEGYFPLCADGLRRNARLAREREIAVNRHLKASESGQKGNAKRWSSGGDRKPIAKRSHRAYGSGSDSGSVSASGSSPEHARAVDVGAALSAFPSLEVPQVKAAIEAYLAGRRERRQKPQTARGLSMALKGISSLDVAGACDVIDQATAGGWLGWPADAARKSGHGPVPVEPKGFATLRSLSGRSA